MAVFPLPLDIKLEGKEHPQEDIEGILALLGGQRGNLLLFSAKRKITINTSHF